MKVSCKSWHYRAVDRIFQHPSRNLCVYFWQVVWVCTGVPTIVILLGGWALMPFYWWLGPSEMFGGAIVAGALDIVILCNIWSEYRSDLRWKGKLPPKRRKAKEPSLFGEWLRAKKQKVCPLLEFE